MAHKISFSTAIFQGFFLFTLLPFFLLSVKAADLAHPFYHHEIYNRFTGLPTSEANDVQQTHDGQIWIASYSGLIRYDGRTFESYADQGFSSVLCLYEDQKNRLWIGTNNDGIVLYDNNVFTFIADHQEIPSFSTRAISELSDGTLVVGTAMGLYQITPDFTVVPLNDPLLKDLFIVDMASFGENNTIGISKSGDIFILEGSNLVSFIRPEDHPYPTPVSVLPLLDGDRFFIGTNQEYILEMIPHAGSVLGYRFLPISTPGLSHINTSIRDSQGQIWIGSDSGVGYFDSNRQLNLLDYINISSFESICEDHEGNFWLASAKEGVLKLTVSPFQNVTSRLSDLIQVNGVEILGDSIYIVSPNGIDIIDKETHQPMENTLTQRYRGDYFRCVEKDFDGNLWFSSYTDDRLIKYNPVTEEITPISEAEGLDTARIRSTLLASDGRIWVGTGNGVYVVDEDHVVAHYGNDEGLRNLEILTLSQDLQDRVFVGTDGAGMYIIEDGVVTAEIGREHGLASDIILRTETDPMSGGTWMVTGNSLAYYDTDLGVFHSIDHFPYSNNFDILFYQDNMIILSSNGIYFTTRDYMLADDESFQYLYKNHFDGLFSTPVANSFSIIEDGVLYLCGYQNLTSFDMTADDSSRGSVPSIDLPKILVNQSPIYPGLDGSYVLPAGTGFLELDILIPTYSLQDYNIHHRIVGYDEQSHITNYHSFLNPTYTNLPGGKYTLLVKIVDGRTGELINEKEFSITKAYTFTESPVIRTILGFLIILSFVILSHLTMKKRLQKVEEQRQQARSMFSDTVELVSKVIDVKDQYTTGHSNRVAYYSRAIAKALSQTAEEQESVYGIALLHDVGKITIPDAVLNKPGRLNEEEFVIMKTHSSNGAEILESIRAWPDLILGAKYHHERYDGTGYPNRLKGEEIPLIARIICIADCFDAMFSSRVYRKKMELSRVLEELERNSGSQFDPELVEIFIDLVQSGQLDALFEELDPN